MCEKSVHTLKDTSCSTANVTTCCGQCNSQSKTEDAVKSEKMRRTTNDAMAECLDLLRCDLIEAGVISENTPPMFMTEAILGYVNQLRAQLKAATEGVAVTPHPPRHGDPIIMAWLESDEGKAAIQESLRRSQETIQTLNKERQYPKHTDPMPELICRSCGADRLKQDCRGDRIQCPIQGQAQ